MATQIVQARITDTVLAQLAADADALGLESTSAAVREGIELLHRKAEQVRLAQAYDEFYAATPAPVGDIIAALWEQRE